MVNVATVSNAGALDQDVDATELKVAAVTVPTLSLVNTDVQFNNKDTSDSTENIEIPSSNGNPYLQTNTLKQGALYSIILPIIGMFFVIYIVGVIISRFRAKKQAKSVEPFDREYEFNDIIVQNNNASDFNNANADPFNDVYESGNSFFFNSATNFEKGHKKNRSSGDLLSQYRRSIDHLSGLNIGNDASISHQRNKSDASLGATLQLNFPQPHLTPDNDSNGIPKMLSSEQNQQPFYATGATMNISSIEANHSSEPSSLYYSLAEPTKSANRSPHRHHRTLSSLALDDFINTGELPQSKISDTDVLMYENSNMSNNSITNSRSSSPQRSFRVYNQQRDLSRSPSRSPVRNLNRSPIRSPAKSPIRSTLT